MTLTAASRGRDVERLVGREAPVFHWRLFVLEVALGLVFFCLPISGASVGLGEIDAPSGQELAAKAFLLLGVATVAVLFTRAAFVPGWAWGSLALMTCLGVATAPFSVAPSASLIDGLLLAGSVAVSGYLAAALGAKRTIRSIAVSSCLLVVASVAVERLFTASSANVLSTDGLFGVERLTGLFTDPNTLGQTAAVGAVAAAVLLFRYQAPRVAIVCGVVSLLGGAASQSRTALIALVVALLVSCFTNSRSRRLAAVGAALVLVTVSFIPEVSSEVTDTFTRSGDPNEVLTLTGRTRVWRAAIDVAKDRPIFGHGVGTSPPVLTGQIRDGQITWPALHAHNAGLQVLVTQGVAGLSLLLFSLVRWFTAGNRLTALDPLLWLVVVGTVTEVLVYRVPSSYFLVLCAVLVFDRADRATTRVGLVSRS